ncbi:MAG: 3-dehydroquinate synthase II [Methanomassiliicoccales archaeon]|nr:3-dehydroquinate synthase II [Methanomassiliicoccales archaeon]
MSGKGKIVWVRADHLPSATERKRMVTSALEAGYADIVLREEDAALQKVGRYFPIVRRGDGLFADNKQIGVVLTIHDHKDAERASRFKGKHEFVLVESHDWKVIPLENLIAEFQGTSTKVIASCSSLEEAELFAATLETGVDGLAITIDDPSKLSRFSGLGRSGISNVELTEATVKAVRPVNVGDRVCVDTCSLLNIGEGMLVGSQSACLFLVQSESMDSQYVSSRPFRVNAGAVHAYVLGADGRTKYLSEVKSGTELLAVDASGRTRPVVVGRAKVEVRPLLLLEAEADGTLFTTILQNAETIRLCTREGSISISDLKEGDKVLVRLEQGGRHFGHAVKESVVER